MNREVDICIRVLVMVSTFGLVGVIMLGLRVEKLENEMAKSKKVICEAVGYGCISKCDHAVLHDPMKQSDGSTCSSKRAGCPRANVMDLDVWCRPGKNLPKIKEKK